MKLLDGEKLPANTFSSVLEIWNTLKLSENSLKFLNSNLLAYYLHLIENCLNFATQFYTVVH